MGKRGSTCVCECGSVRAQSGTASQFPTCPHWFPYVPFLRSQKSDRRFVSHLSGRYDPKAHNGEASRLNREISETMLRGWVSKLEELLSSCCRVGALIASESLFRHLFALFAIAAPPCLVISFLFSRRGFLEASSSCFCRAATSCSLPAAGVLPWV